MAVPGEPGPQAIFRCLQSIFRLIFRSQPSFTFRLRLMYICVYTQYQCVVIYIEFGLVYIQVNLETSYTLIYSGFYFQMLQPEWREGYLQIDIRLIFRRSESIFRLIFRIFGYFYFQIAFTFRLQAALYVHKCGVCSVCQLYGVNVYILLEWIGWITRSIFV